MKIIQVQNYPRHGGGASVHFCSLVDSLRAKGHEVTLLVRRSEDLGTGLRGKSQAFTSGLHSRSAYRTMIQLIRSAKPDIVHVHDLYPLLVSTLRACGEEGIPVVMTCHNYRFGCPTLLHLSKGKVCEKCLGGHEYWCILNNCRNDIFESTTFALHNVIARKCRLFLDNVTLFIAMTNFSKVQLEKAGIPKSKIEILPNAVSVPVSTVDSRSGSYAAYVGRFSVEKGLDTLLQAAALNPTIPVHLAGDYSLLPKLQSAATTNVTFVGHLDRTQLDAFYRGSRFLVLPSRCFEMCPMVVLEAHSYGLPVIASRIGSLKDMIDDSETGVLFDPGNAQDLAIKMTTLWESSDLCAYMGHNAREQLLHKGNAAYYVDRLVDIYERAIRLTHDRYLDI